jgi:limonene-1,2-epoxide hydrolase
MATHIEIVNRIIEAWKRGDVDGVLSHLAEDVEYHYLVGERPLIGKDWVRRFLEKFGHGQTDIRWRVVNHASNGDRLLVEGIDDYVDAEGRRIQTPYMGIFEFRDGKVRRWRDYVDTGLIAKAKAGEAFPEWLEALIA